MSHEIAIPFRSRLRGITLVDPGSALQIAPPGRDVAGNQTSATSQANQAEEERAAVQAVLAGLRKSMEELRTREQQRLGEMQHVAVELAVAIASRLTHVKIQAGDFGVEEVVREVIEQIDRKQPATLFLHPTDLALLEGRIENLDSLFQANEKLRFDTDATLARGSCRAEFGDVSIWSQWQHHLPEIHDHLVRSIQDAGPRHREA